MTHIKSMRSGYLLKEVAGLLPREKFPDPKGLAEKTLHGNVKKGREAPRDIAEYLMTEEGMPNRPGYERTAKVVRLGLAALRGLHSPTLAKKLDGLGGKLDTAHAKIDANGGKLDKLLSEVEAIRVLFKVAVHVTATVLLLGVLGFAGHQLRADVSSGETANATRVPRVPNAVNGAMSAADALLRAALAALDMGKKEEKELWVPKEPAPWQKLAKDCNPDLGETAINGGCWVLVGNMAPPCKLLFRHGNACYRPVSADPTKPVGMSPVVPGQR